MPSQGIFSNTPPAPGEIRVLILSSSAGQTIRSVVISDTDKNGNKIKPSLSEINKLVMPISSSGVNSTLNILDINQKEGYFFLNNEDFNIGTASNSLNAEIAVDPFLIEPFTNNQYNALISNAEAPRANFLKYDVDRVGGVVSPDNFNAIAGNPQINLTLFHSDNNGVALENIEVPSGYFSNVLSEISSTAKQHPLNTDITAVFTTAEIENAFNTPLPTVASIPNSFLTAANYSFNMVTSLYLELDTVSTFDSSLLSSTEILKQTYLTGEVTTETQGKKATFSSTAGDFLYVRLRQKVLLTSSTNQNPIVTIQTFFGDLDKYLQLFLFTTTQIPYAQKASVQDSNYTDTGLINARYEGTKTSEDDYSGIAPSISATRFEGTLYPYSSTAASFNTICSESLADREVETLQFSGKGTQPSVGSGIVGTTYGALTTSDTQIILRTEEGSLVTAGDVLVIGSEKIQVLVVNYARRSTVDPNTGIKTLHPFLALSLVIARAYDGTTATTHLDTAQFFRVGGSRVFTINGNRILPVGKRLIWLKESSTIVATNDKGYIESLKETCTV